MSKAQVLFFEKATPARFAEYFFWFQRLFVNADYKKPSR